MPINFDHSPGGTVTIVGPGSGTTSITLPTANHTGNQILGANNGATGTEWKTLTAGGGISIVHGANAVTFSASGTQHETRTLPVTVDDCVDIGTWTITNGAHCILIGVAMSASGMSVAKQFVLATQYNHTSGAWQIVEPISDAGPYVATNFQLEATQTNNVLSLRLRKTLGAVSNTVHIHMLNVGDTADVFAASSTVTAGAAVVTARLTTQNLSMKMDGKLYHYGTQILSGDGTVSLPTYSFVGSNGANDGMYRPADNTIAIAVNGANGFYVNTTGIGPGSSVNAPLWSTSLLRLNVSNTFGWADGNNSSTMDVILQRDAAATLALRNGATAQTFRVWNNYTDVSNGEWLDISWASNVVNLVTNQNGSGTSRSMQIGTTGIGALNLRTNNTNHWAVSGSTGNFIAVSDNATDIGGPSNRARSGYFGTSLFSGGTTQVANEFLSVQAAYTSTGSNNRGTWLQATNNAAANNTGVQTSVQIRSTHASTFTLTGLQGLSIDSVFSATVGNVGHYYGIYQYGSRPATAGTVATYINILQDTLSAGTGTITDFIGLDIRDQSTTNTVRGIQSRIASGTGKLNIYVSGTAPSRFDSQILLGDGTNTLPGIAFNSDTSQGLWRYSASFFGLTDGGSGSGAYIGNGGELYVGRPGSFWNLYTQNAAAGNTVALNALSGLGWSSGAADSTVDVFLYRGGANILSLKNGSNAQAFRVYNTEIDGSNYEFGTLSWAGNILYLSTLNAGSGVARSIYLNPADSLSLGSEATSRWVVSGGHFVPSSDNSYDIGGVSDQIRDIFVGGTVFSSGGDAANPSYTFSTNTDTGLFHGAAGVGISYDGVARAATHANALAVLETGSFAFSSTALETPTITYELLMDGGLGIRNGSAPAILTISGGWTDASNWTRAEVGWNAGGLGANTFGIVTNKAGTGTANKDIYLAPNGTGRVYIAPGNTPRWYFTNDKLSPASNDAYDIGDSAIRVRDIWLHGKVYTTGITFRNLDNTPAIAPGVLKANSSGQIVSGQIHLMDIVDANTMAYQPHTSVNIDGGTIDGVSIGSSSASTGAFTTISASGQITSTLATGTAPFVIASTTQVANLNASQLIGATWASPGAIGSTTASTGAFTSLSASGVLNLTQATGAQITLSGATSNWIQWAANGVATPAFTTRSAGTKLVIYPALGASTVDYAIGISSSTLWYSIPGTATTYFHRWYAGTTSIAELRGDGNFAVTGTSSATQLISTVSTGTAPLSVTSTTVVPNLNVSQLLGATWASPGAIGSTTATTGVFTSLDATSRLALRNGDNNTGSGNTVQIQFGYNGANQYLHFIRTRHNSTAANNAIDFYVSDGTVSGVFPTNATLGATIDNIGVTAPRLVSTIATGTAPLSVTSTTVVPNLNVSQLLGGTWASPGAIGSTAASSGAFTTLSASSTITGSSTVAGASFRLNGYTYSRVGDPDGSGGFISGFNLKYSSGVKHDSVGAISGVHYTTSGTIDFFTNTSQAVDTAATSRWRIQAAGHFVAISDNSFDIGASGANRPRNLYLAGTVTANSLIVSTYNIGSVLTLNAYKVLDMSAPTNPELGPSNIAALAARSGRKLHPDEEFAAGTNSVNLYNNTAGSTDVTVTRINTVTGAPNATGWVMEIRHTDINASPGFGGFAQIYNHALNKVIMQVFKAKVPVGYTLNTAQNSAGTNSRTFWLTNQTGTGKWEYYIRVVECGNTGTFSNGGHVYLTGSPNPTPGTPVVWYLASCAAYDITDLHNVTYAASGTVALPSYSFAVDSDTGFLYSSTLTGPSVSVQNSEKAGWGTTGYQLKSDYSFGWSSGNVGATSDVILVRDGAANTLAMKNGTNAQAFRVYGTTTGPKYVTMRHDGTDAYVDTSASSGALKLGINSATAVHLPVNTIVGTTTAGAKAHFVLGSSTGNVATWGNELVVGAAGTTGGGIGLAWDTTNNVSTISSLTPGVAWRVQHFRANSYIFYVNGSTGTWQINSSGHLVAVTDNTFDIGQSGANRARHLYLSGDITAAGNAAITGDLTINDITASGNVIVTGDVDADNITGTDLLLDKATGPQITLDGATSNWIHIANKGTATPGTTTRSLGTKYIVNPSLSGSTLDFAIGHETDAMWFSAANASSAYKFYFTDGISTDANVTITPGVILLGNTTSNRIQFNGNGVGDPTFTTRSAGSKFVIAPTLSGSTADYAIGVGSASMWFSLPTSSNALSWKWFGGTTMVAELLADGAMTISGLFTAERLVSTVATGTSPIAVNSTTAVVNLNADLLDGFHATYFAPIASPALTGVPTAPTATLGTNTTQLATTAFVQAALGGTSLVNSFNGRTGAVSLLMSDLTSALGGAQYGVLKMGMDGIIHINKILLSDISDANTMAYQRHTGVDIDGGSIDGTTIGASSAAAATFTTITASGLVTLNSASGNKINFTGGTSNWIQFGSGLGTPAFTTRSAGTKIVLWDGLSGSTVDYALGINNSEFWASVTGSSASFKWYAATTNIATLSGAGAFSVSSTVTGTQLISSVATGTAPLSVTSTTVVPNLNVSQLLGATWASPGAIGSTAASTGAFTSLSASTTLTLSQATGGQLLFTGGTSNWIQWNTSGAGVPTVTTRSVGTKLVLYPSLSGTEVDFALGIAAGELWSSIGAAANSFKWYAATTNIATLSGAGALTLSAGLSATTGSFSGQITSTVSTGTAPFVVASTTQVANLNASQLIGGTWASPGAIGSTTASTGAFSTLSATGVFTATGGAKISVQESTDGTSARGIFMWNESDTNWGIYMSTSGASKSIAGGTATTSIDGRTSHHIRFRTGVSTGNGFIWEGSDEACKMSLGTDTGLLHVASAGGYGISNDVYLRRDGAGVLAQRNGTNAQTQYIYETYTDGSNYSRVEIVASSTISILARSAGTGTARAMAIGTVGATALNFQTSATNRWLITSGGNLQAVTDNSYDIGASGANRPRHVYVAGNIDAAGNLTAATKSFVIPHKSKPGKKLHHGSLEGAEHGVYFRGRLTDENVIELPEYWTWLVDEKSITVQLTSIGHHQELFVVSVSKNKVTIKNSNLLNKRIDCYFIIHGERKDVAKLVVEHL